MKKTAFTLAEVLITLGIIGVVAAITIPGLINNYKAARLRAAFLRSYSLIQQAFKQMENDDVSVDPDDYATRTFYKTFMTYFSGTTDCGYAGSSCSGLGGTTYKNLNNQSITRCVSSKWNIFDDGQFILKDGTLIMLENANRLWVHVDINGYNNPPNKAGYDLFTFEFLDGELRTMGSLDTEYYDSDNKYCDLESTASCNGLACAHLAKTDTEYFKTIVKKVK